LGTGGFAQKTPLIRPKGSFPSPDSSMTNLWWKKALNGQYLPSCNSCRNENNQRGNLGPPWLQTTGDCDPVDYTNCSKRPKRTGM
jgi:hypothetical protein